MVDYREILRRHSLGDSIRAIALGVNSSRDTVSATLRAAKAARVEWPLDDDVSNGVLQDILFPGKYAYASPFTVPDFAKIHEALAKKGVTLTLLHTEHLADERGKNMTPKRFFRGILALIFTFAVVYIAVSCSTGYWGF